MPFVPSRSSTGLRAALASIALLLLASGCARGGDTGADATAAAPTPVPTPCVLEGASTEAQESEGDRPFSPVTDVRPNDEGCPRVVFEFSDDVPGYRVAYAQPPFSECGSGDEIDTSGWGAEAYLQVRLEPSSGVDTMGEFQETYGGPRDISFDGQILKHMKVACDFEAIFEWIVGLDEEHPFTVVTFDDPARLVIDVSQG